MLSFFSGLDVEAITPFLGGGLGFLRIHSEDFVISGAKLVKFSIF